MNDDETAPKMTHWPYDPADRDRREYSIIDETFEFPPDFDWAAWNLANPSLGRAIDATLVIHTHQAAEDTQLTRHLSEAVRNRRHRGRGLSGDRFILDELKRFTEVETHLEFKLTDWQEDTLRMYLGVDDEHQVLGVLDGNMFVGPSSEYYAEQFLARAIWDEVARLPWRDGEMLNRVIDDIATDATAKIMCPEFPRVE